MQFFISTAITQMLKRNCNFARQKKTGWTGRMAIWMCWRRKKPSRYPTTTLAAGVLFMFFSCFHVKLYCGLMAKLMRMSLLIYNLLTKVTKHQTIIPPRKQREEGGQEVAESGGAWQGQKAALRFDLWKVHFVNGLQSEITIIS